MEEQSVTLRIEDKNYDFAVMRGTEGEVGIDFRKLRADTGYVSYDEAYANTGSCESKITFVDGEKGILRYRGYPIEELAEHSTFVETAYLLIYGELPTQAQLQTLSGKLAEYSFVHEDIRHFFQGFPKRSHPMAILSAMVNSLGCFYPHMSSNNKEQDLVYFDDAAAMLISKVRALAAMSYRMKLGLPPMYPDKKMRYCQNFLHLMFSEPYDQYQAPDCVARALDLIFLLHADHEQNCSTSTVRTVASSGANLFSAVSAGICALWGPLHGGANMAVIRMLNDIHQYGDDGSQFIQKAKTGEAKLMGFGHRVYKNFDPRARILKEACSDVLETLGLNDPLLDIAMNLEQKALEDDYFVERKLYPNVDFYSGIILQALHIPIDLFTVIFAIGRTPGWIANWKEVAENPKGRIYRPRQLYMGEAKRAFVPRDKR